MEGSQLLTQRGSHKLSREELQTIPTPPASATHQPLAHHATVEALIETLGFRQIAAVRDEYAVSQDGMRMFGVLDLETTYDGCRFSIGLRNANDKSMRLALTVGYRVLVCDNMAFYGDYTPVLAKHTKHFALVDALAVGVDAHATELRTDAAADRGVEGEPDRGHLREARNLPSIRPR